MTGELDRPATLAEIIEDLDPDGSIRAGRKKGDADRASPVASHGHDIDPDGLPPLARRVDRARRYLTRIPPAVQGQGGSNPTFTAARALVHGLCLDEATALGLLLAEYNPRCEPPWSVKELEHKVADAAAKPHSKPRGWLLTPKSDRRMSTASTPVAPPASGPPPAPPPGSASNEGESSPDVPLNEADDDPHRLARAVLAGYQSRNRRTLSYWRGEFHSWDGCRYTTKGDKEFRPKVNRTVRRELEAVHRVRLEAARQSADGELPRMTKVTDSLVGNTLAALQGMALVTDVADSPAWINGAVGPDPRELVPARNGLIHLPAYAVRSADAVRENTPDYLNFNAVEFDADPAAPVPSNWLAFLRQLWPDDPESIALLQEWFGYLLSPETRAQKMLLMVGPPRSGKGTINGVLQALVGEENCATPALSGDDGLGGRFGLQSLLQKSVAIVEDARIARGPATTTAVARMLTVSGEGCITVDRKNAPALPRVRLYARFVIATNEMPDLPDASTALARRWCILRMTKSFYGQEDPDLADRLVAELPGIFNWAVEGWQRLRERRWRFTVPEASRREAEELIDLSSPVTEFLRERCEVGPDFRTPCKDVYAVWRQWCEDSGRREPGTDKQFGRLLAAADATIHRFRLATGSRSWCYPIRIRETDDDGDMVPWERWASRPNEAESVPTRPEKSSAHRTDLSSGTDNGLRQSVPYVLSPSPLSGGDEIEDRMAHSVGSRGDNRSFDRTYGTDSTQTYADNSDRPESLLGRPIGRNGTDDRTAAFEEGEL